MPVSRSHRSRPKPRQVPTIDLDDGDTLNIVFDSNKITPAWTREAERRDEEKDTLSLPKALAEVILKWDFVEDDGTEIPVSVDELAGFSYPVQKLLLEQIMKSAVPSSEEGNGSRNISSGLSSETLDEPESLRNGQAPSPLPEPLESPSPT